MAITSSKKHIFVINNVDDQRIFYLDNDCYSIGRTQENSIIINSKKVSRKHATLIKKKTKTENHVFCIIDGDLDGNRSTNGIFINGNKYL